MKAGHLFLLALLSILGGLSLLSSLASAADPPRPNVVLFLVDDMGWMDSSAYGSQYYATPHMQRLAQQAMRFTDAYALPLCSPTRASILTGQYSSRHGVTSASGHRPPQDPDASLYPEAASATRPLIYAESRNYLLPEAVTLAEVLQQAGYRTGHFGKWHLGLMPQHWPNTQGFETTFHCAPDPGPPSYFSPYGVTSEGQPGGQRRVGNITDGPEGEYITDRLTDEALAFIEAHQHEPFYLNLWQYGVHGPWGHKAAYTAEFADKRDPRGQQGNPIMASMLRSVDESLGRVLDKLDQLQLTDNTLFIFYSDNGGNVHSNVPDDRKLAGIKPGHPKYAAIQDWRKWAGDQPPTNNAPLRDGKGKIYEGGIRVPLMVRWPGKIAAGSTSAAVVGPIDLYPTILDALQLAQPQGHAVDGVSLLPVLSQTQQGELPRDGYFTWFPHQAPAVALRQGNWKLIRRFEPAPDYPDGFELFDLATDLGETTNLAARMPERVERMNRQIDRFLSDSGALLPKPNPAYDPNRAATSRPAAGRAAGGSIQGLVPKFSTATIVDGALHVAADGRRPFLGTVQIKHTGAARLRVVTRTPAGGPGQVQWRTADQETFPASGQTVDFQIPAGPDWQTTVVDLPVEGRLVQLRLYLPADRAPVDIQSLQFLPADSDEPVHAWDFSHERSAGGAEGELKT